MTSIETVRKSNRRILAFVMVLLLCLTLLPGAALAANTSATTMSLMDWEGEKNVTVKASSGTSKTVRKGMSLYNGYTVTTGAGGRAWIALDGSKTITLNASSSVEVRSSGGKIDVLLNAGELNFSSDGPVGAGKNYNVITQNAVCGIIGSFGWVDSDAIGLLHGKTKVTCTDPLTGKVVVKFIDTGTLLSYVGDEAHTNGMDPALNSIGFETRRMRNEDVPAAMVQEILADPAKQLQMADVPSLDLQVLTDTLPEKLAAEAAAAEAAQAGADAAAAAQELRVAAEAGASLTVPEGGDATVGGGAAVGDAVGTEAGGKVLDLWDAAGKDIAGTGETDVNAGATTTDDSGATTGGSGGDSGSGGGTTPDGEKHGYLSVIIPTGVGQSVDVALKRGATVISQYVEGSESATYTVLSGETLTLALGTLPDGWEWTVSAAMWITGGPEEGITAAVEGTGNTRTITVPTIGDSDVLESFIVSAVAEQSTQTQIYDITIDSSVAHGTVTATMDGEHPVTGAEAGKSVILGFTPDEGYECSAGSVVPDGGGEVETSAISDNGCTFTMPAKPVTVYANFTPRTYNVTLHTEGGTINAGNVTSYTYNVDALLPTDVTRDGFRFDGWYDAASGGTTSIGIIAAGASGAQEYWAYWTQLYGVTVTQPQNGTLSADKTTAAAGETVTLTVTPATSYVLDQLTIKDADNGTVAVNNNAFTMPAKNVTVTATFKAATYTVTLNPNEGKINAGNVTGYTYGTGATLPTDVTREGFRFDGWYDAASGGSRVTAIGADETGAKEYWAHWTQLYTVTVTQPQNGTVTADKQTAAAGETVTLTVTPATGYELDALTATYGNDLTVEPTQDSDDDTKWSFAMPAGDATVSAAFAPAVYPVKLNENGGTFGESHVQNYTYGVGATLPDDLTREGFRFDGWYDAASGGSRVTAIGADETGAKEYWAHWTQLYTVTVDATITGGTVTADREIAAAGETVTLTVSPSEGWEVSSAQHAVRAQYFNTQANENASVDATQAQGNAATWTFTMPEGDATVYAAFVKTTYAISGLDDIANGTIEWSVNGLTHEPNATPQAQVGDTVTLTLRGRADDPPAPPSAPPQYIDAGLEVQCEDETPVTATLSGTRTTYEYTYEYGTTDPVELTGTGYAATYTFVMPAGNVMVSAQFATVCELTFDPGDGNGTGYGDVAAAGAGYILPACTFTPPEDGMAFAGWSDGYSDKFYAAGSTYTIDANVASVVFTAMWGISEDLHGSVDVSELVKQSDYAGMTVAVTNDDMAYTDLSTEGYLLFGVGLGDMLQIELRDANGNGIAGLNVTATVYCDPSFSADWSSYITSTSEDGVFVMSLPEVVEGTDNPLSSLILTFTAG